MSYQTRNKNALHSMLAALLRKPWAQMGVGLGALAPVMALANPTGGNVVGGHATITAPNANSTVIDQTTQRAIINWQSFNIGGGQLVQFVQPSSSSVVLNRVIGGGASSIFGDLTANGQVFLINTSGILFGKSAQIDVQGIVASSLDMRNRDFLNGNYVFTQGSGAPSA